MLEIYIRPLRIEDANISYKWRNNPKIWEFTGNRPDKEITQEIEMDWINKVLNLKNEKRYAICINGSDEYIGNIQLTNIKNGEAEFHIFIGEQKYWGKGFASSATKKLLEISKSELQLSKIYLFVNLHNKQAISVYKKNGFLINSIHKDIIKMELLL